MALVTGPRRRVLESFFRPVLLPVKRSLSPPPVKHLLSFVRRDPHEHRALTLSNRRLMSMTLKVSPSPPPLKTYYETPTENKRLRIIVFLCPTKHTCQQKKARNRLSKFEYFPGDPASTRASEEVLLTTAPKASNIHAAGWCDFPPSAYGKVSGGYGLHEEPRYRI